MKRKIMFGSGGTQIDGWECYDSEVDIRKPLPFPNGSARYIAAEHVLEHVTHQEAWSFLDECRRILVKDGIIRIAIPDISQMWAMIKFGQVRGV